MERYMAMKKQGNEYDFFKSLELSDHNTSRQKSDLKLVNASR